MMVCYMHVAIFKLCSFLFEIFEKKILFKLEVSIQKF
jgi:hypothetical protein